MPVMDRQAAVEQAGLSIEAARDGLIATYERALLQGDASPAVGRLVVRAAISANSAAAAERLATGWPPGVAAPMERFAGEVKRHDLLGRATWPGGAILLSELGVARLTVAILLGVIAWLLRAADVTELLQVLVCVLLLLAMLYILGGPVHLDETADELDERIRQLVEPAQSDFFALAGGPPPMTDPANVLRANVHAARRLLLLGFLGVILSPLIAAALSVVRSQLGGG
jgi:hypothetical protein